MTAAEDEEALAKIRAEPPDLVVLDRSMPGLDGFAFVRCLKADPKTAALPVLLLTDEVPNADIFASSQCMDAYMTQPFSPAELLLFVRRLCEWDPYTRSAQLAG